MLGLNLHYYWTITPNQFNKYVEMYKQKEEMRIREIDAHNFNLGKYIAIAFNAPDKYPKEPFLHKQEETKPMTAIELDRMMQRNTIILGGELK